MVSIVFAAWAHLHPGAYQRLQAEGAGGSVADSTERKEVVVTPDGKVRLAVEDVVMPADEKLKTDRMIGGWAAADGAGGLATGGITAEAAETIPERGISEFKQQLKEAIMQ